MKTKAHTIQQKIYVTAKIDQYLTDGVAYEVQSYDPTTYRQDNSIVIDTFELDVKIKGNIELTADTIAILEEKKKDLQTTYLEHKQLVEEEIANLRCLEHNPDGEADPELDAELVCAGHGEDETCGACFPQGEDPYTQYPDSAADEARMKELAELDSAEEKNNGIS